ncbi:MAG: hypothetical protein HC872_01385 [Gammaproteobacteria bacterium]|nr:hypothetical protein [Gammaproteobacteria bacterium]
MWVLLELSVYVSVAIIVVALLRRLLRRTIGAQLAYWIWSLVPACAVVTMLPPPVRSSNASSDGLSQSLVSMLPLAR